MLVAVIMFVIFKFIQVPVKIFLEVFVFFVVIRWFIDRYYAKLSARG